MQLSVIKDVHRLKLTCNISFRVSTVTVHSLLSFFHSKVKGKNPWSCKKYSSDNSMCVASRNKEHVGMAE